MPALVVDNREHGLIAELGRLGVDHTVEALSVGDFAVRSDDGQTLVIAERKSHADFAASNADGRYREQRARLMAARGGGTAVLYVLEGTWSGREDTVIGWRTTEGQLRRLTTRLLLRYGMPVLMSRDLADTASWARLLLAQVTDDGAVFVPEEGGVAVTAALAGLTAALSTARKGNKTPASTAAAMLSAVPGLGEKRVTALLAERSLGELAAMSVEEVAGLVVGGKRIGAAVATTIVAALAYKPVAPES
jgi:ERCC4-type nuclease